MKPKTRIALLLVLYAIVSLAHAEKLDCKKGYLDPTKLALCTGMDAEAAEARLKVVVRKMMDSLGRIEAEFAREYPDREALRLKADLEAGQQAWLKYREFTCDLSGNLIYSGSPNRGGPAGVERMYCSGQMARNRIRELNEMSKNLGAVPPRLK